MCRDPRPDAATADSVVVMDIGDRDGVSELVERLKPTVIIHAAAVNPGQGPEAEMMRINADCSRNVVDESSTDGPPTPINAYGRSKAAGE